MPDSRFATEIKRRRPWRRDLRIVWRDTLALWLEFRIPIALFLFVVVVGGFVYGELHSFAFREAINAGEEHAIPLIDRPYYMMQLMILETPGEAPPQWYLVIFWYLLPVLFIFIAAFGAADFVHLFFNRSERQDAWREAVASTYRHHIIVFGAGHVGMRVIVELEQMGFEIVAIDASPDPGVEELLAKLRVPLLMADGRLVATLEKAGLRHAESFVACTGNDHVNLEAIMKARDMNPDVRIVARVWDDQFARQIERFMNVQTVLSSSNLAAPAFAAAALGIEITQTLNINGIDYSMVRLKVEPDSFMEGKTIGGLQQSEDMDIVLHSFDDQVDVQPSRDLAVNAGDTLVIFARHTQILSIVARNQRPQKKIQL